MASKPVHNWLAGPRNFHVGAALYNAFGKDGKIKTLLAKGKSPATEKILHDALSAMAAAPPEKPVKPPPEVQAFNPMPESADTVLQALRNQWLPLYQQMNYLRHQLDAIRGNTPEKIEQRRPMALEILALEQQCMHIWGQRAYYEEHGQLPGAPAEEKQPDIPTDPLQLGIYVENLKRQIRRKRNAMNTPGAKAKYAIEHAAAKALYKTITGKDYDEAN